MSESRETMDELCKRVEQTDSFMRIYTTLPPAIKDDVREYIEWMMHDGRPETDPTRHNEAWQEWKRRERAEAE